MQRPDGDRVRIRNRSPGNAPPHGFATNYAGFVGNPPRVVYALGMGQTSNRVEVLEDLSTERTVKASLRDVVRDEVKRLDFAIPALADVLGVDPNSLNPGRPAILSYVVRVQIDDGEVKELEYEVGDRGKSRAASADLKGSNHPSTGAARTPSPAAAELSRGDSVDAIVSGEPARRAGPSTGGLHAALPVTSGLSAVSADAVSEVREANVAAPATHSTVAQVQDQRRDLAFLLIKWFEQREHDRALTVAHLRNELLHKVGIPDVQHEQLKEALHLAKALDPRLQQVNRKSWVWNPKANEAHEAVSVHD